MIPNHPEWSNYTTYVGYDMGAQSIAVDTLPEPRSVSAGPDVLSQSNGVVNVRNHVAYFENGNLYIRSENDTGDAWTAATLLGTITEVPDSLSLAFDQLGRPQVVYDAAGSVYLYGYNPVTATIGSRFICAGTTPVAAMDYPRDTSRATCDILIAYVHNNQVKFRQQRDKYETEYMVLATLPGPNVKLLDCGFRKDRRFGINYRYDYVPVVPPAEPNTSDFGAKISIASFELKPV